MMQDEIDVKNTAALLKKINGMRTDIQSKDWAKDKIMSLPGGRGYWYLSAEKMMGNIAPLFSKHGIEFLMEFSELTQREPVGNMTQHWTIRLDVTLLDSDTAAFIRTTVYGEAADSGDKGLAKAQTSAVKKWAASFFWLSDNIDPDDEDVQVGSTFKPKTPARTEKAKTEAFKHAANDELKGESKTEEPKEESEESVKTPVETIDAPEPGSSLPELKFTPNKPQIKVLENILATYNRKRVSGEVTPEEYNQMSMDMVSMENSKDAIAFIKKYREVE